MKGIILAGGRGTRLYPSTIAVSKHLLTIYDKPMIYYPISTLMLAGIRDILIITTPDDISLYQKLLGDGDRLGLKFSYKSQLSPRGIADAFIIGEEFIGNANVCLALGDNIFHGHRLMEILQNAAQLNDGCLIFGYHVSNPSKFGILNFDNQMNVISIEEKPRMPKSNYAIPGLYFYDNEVVEIAKKVKVSERGELEISDLNSEYLKLGKLKVRLLERGIAWLDTGTHKSMLKASNYIESLQTRQGLYICCIEEIAFRMGYIDADQLRKLGESLITTDYGKYLFQIANTAKD